MVQRRGFEVHPNAARVRVGRLPTHEFDRDAVDAITPHLVTTVENGTPVSTNGDDIPSLAFDGCTQELVSDLVPVHPDYHIDHGVPLCQTGITLATVGVTLQ